MTKRAQIHEIYKKVKQRNFYPSSHRLKFRDLLASRDANFQDAEIVRSEEHRGLGPRAGPSGVQEQRHFGGPREICHCISDIQKILQKNKLKPCLIKITGCYLVFTLKGI